MKKFSLFSFFMFLSFCVPQVANAIVYIPDYVSSQNAVFNADNNTVTVSGVVPTKTEYDWNTYEQYDLPYVSYVLIERRISGEEWPAEECGRINNPTMGESFEFIDKNVTLDTSYEYRISCYVDEQGSSTVYASVYTGITPGEVIDFTLSVADHTTNNIDMSMKAPLKSDQDVDLTEKMSIEIQQYEDWSFTTIHTIENVAPGELCTWQFKDLPMNKRYEFRAVARVGKNGIGQGLPVSIFVGLDYPGTPVNFTAVSKGENVELTWEQPVAGGRNGCYNPEETTYTVTRVYLDGQKEIVKEGIKDTKYVDNTDFDEERALKYELTAVNEAGTCLEAAKSSSIVAGKAAVLPFNESFASGWLTHMGWTKETTQDDPYYTYDAWDFIQHGTMFYFPTDEYLSIEAQDGDEGFASCKFYGDSEDGQTETLVSGHLNVEGMDCVELSFYYWAVIAEASKNAICAYVSKDDGEWEEIYSSVAPDESEDRTWKEISLPINLNKSANNIRVKIAAIRHDGPITNVYIDNIMVKEIEQTETGIKVETADNINETVEYYNLQGARVNNPSVPGLYIKRCGKNTEKIIIK